MLDTLAAKHRVALVTLVLIEGNSPRPLGAQMAVSESGE
ncbi:XdhC family protein [Pararhizobium gei]|nr:XdhC family protein [Rhizobium gei]